LVSRSAISMFVYSYIGTYTIYIFVYTYVGIYTYTCTHIYTHKHTPPAYGYVYIPVYACIHIYVYKDIYIYDPYVYKHIQIYRPCIFMHSYIYIYICTYINISIRIGRFLQKNGLVLVYVCVCMYTHILYLHICVYRRVNVYIFCIRAALYTYV